MAACHRYCKSGLGKIEFGKVQRRGQVLLHRRDEVDARTDSSTSTSTQQSNRSGRPPLHPQHGLSTDGGVSGAAAPSLHDAQAPDPGFDTDQAPDEGPDQPPALQLPDAQPGMSSDGGKQRRRRLTAGGGAEASEADVEAEAAAGPMPYMCVGPAAMPVASPTAPQWQQHLHELREASGSSSQSLRIAAHFQHRSHSEADEADDRAVMDTATSGERQGNNRQRLFVIWSGRLWHLAIWHQSTLL